MSDPKLYRRVLSIPEHGDYDVADADLVIQGTTVIKDRYGEAPREVTERDLLLLNGEAGAILP